METEWIKQGSTFTIVAQPEHVGIRIDKFISQYFEQYSRSFLQKLFEKNQVLVNGSTKVKPSYSLRIGDTIVINFPETVGGKEIKPIPDNVAITTIAKEHDFLIINKPAGLVVHAPNSNYQPATLGDWVAQTHEEIAHVGLIDRPGIVHRLDKNTSGLMIIARNNAAHATFTSMFKNRQIQKTYLAIVVGHPPKEGRIDFYVGRHPTVRNKMHHFTEKTKHSSSRMATSFYKTLQYFKEYSLVEIKPITGRTHQIRVHLAALGFPLLSDEVYGAKSKLMPRHALHAHKLEFYYKDKHYTFTAPLEPDMQNLINSLPS